MKAIQWIGSSYEDLKQFPKTAQHIIGVALDQAQRGGKHRLTKPLRGFGGANVLEVVESFEGSAYRAVYTVQFTECVCVLHCFQKRSKSGIKTPKRDVELIRLRLRKAELEYREWLKARQHPI